MAEAQPFQFEGTACANFTNSKEDFALLLDNKQGFDELVQSYIPSKNVLRLTLGVGFLVAFLVGMMNTIVNIPSQITTTMRFRTGAIESLRDVNFKKYRIAMLNTTFLLGASLWGTLVMSIVVFVPVAFLVFFVGKSIDSFKLMCVLQIVLFLTIHHPAYDITRPFALSFLSLLIGILVTLVAKVILSRFLNLYNFAAFYRKRPLVGKTSITHCILIITHRTSSQSSPSHL